MQHLLEIARVGLDPLKSAECTGEDDEAREEDPSAKAGQDVMHAWDVFEYHIRVL